MFTRRTSRIAGYYAMHGLKLFLERTPKLKAHLDRGYDVDLISEVYSKICYSLHQPSNSIETAFTSDI